MAPPGGTLRKLTVERFESAEALAGVLAERVSSAIAVKPDLVLGLPAGRTPILLYRALVTESRVRGLNWSRVRTFNIDEFVTEPAAGRQPYVSQMPPRRSSV